MAQPERSTILKELAETQRRIAEQVRSMRDTLAASDNAVCESRELIIRIEVQLQTPLGCRQ